MGFVRLLSLLVYLDDPMLPYGLYRLLDEKGQMVGISHPVADDRDNRRILLNLLFAFSVLKATVSPDYPVLRLWYDTLSRGNLQKQEDSNGLSGTRCSRHDGSYSCLAFRSPGLQYRRL